MLLEEEIAFNAGLRALIEKGQQKPVTYRERGREGV